MPGQVRNAEVDTQPWASSASRYTVSASDVSRLPMSESLDHCITREQYGRPINVRMDIKVLERHVSDSEYSFGVRMGDFYGKWEVDDIKRKVLSYLWSELAFVIYRRHFYLELFVPALTNPRWVYLPYDERSSEHLSWNFRLTLKEGRNLDTCGKWF